LNKLKENSHNLNTISQKLNNSCRNRRQEENRQRKMPTSMSN